MLSPEILELVYKTATRFSLDPHLIAAIVMTESAGETYATRFEPAWRYFHFPREMAEQVNTTEETERAHQMTSWGLMQIVGGTAREIGFKGPLPKLLQPEAGLYWGCMKFKALLEKYGQDDAVSAYNQGTPRKTPGGAYQNEKYVDQVFRHYRSLNGLQM